MKERITNFLYPAGRALLVLFLFFFVQPTTTQAQQVSTMLENLSAGNLTLDAGGTIYASDFLGSCASFNTCSNGNVLRRIFTTGRVDTFITWISAPGPTGSVWDDSGNFYVSLYSQNSVVKRDTEGRVSTVATGIHGPTGMVLDGSGNLLVAEGGYTFPAGPGQNIQRVTSAGEVSAYANSSEFNGANGLVRIQSGDLFVANWFTGVIHRVTPAGEVIRLAILPGNASGWMTSVPDGMLVCARNANQIIKVSYSGELSVFAGNGGGGYSDGDAASAMFLRPNGIVATTSGDTVYVAETEARRIRLITNGSVSTIDFDFERTPDSFRLLPAYPNPFNPGTSISYEIGRDAKVNLSVYDRRGNLVETLVNQNKSAGSHTVEWQANGLSSGVYFVRITSGSLVQTQKITLLK